MAINFEKVIEELSKDPLNEIVRSESNAGVSYSLVRGDITLDLFLGQRNMALKVSAKDNVTNKTIAHDIDSDLYDTSRTSNAQFTNKIENKILSVLESVAKDKVVVASRKNNVILIIPIDSKLLIINQRWLGTSVSEYDITNG